MRLLKSASVHKGFTIFELIITLAIIAFICGLSISFFKISDAALVRCEIEKIYSCVVNLQAKARLEKKEKKIVFDLKDNFYNCASTKHKLNSKVSFGFIPATFGPPAKPTKAIDQAMTFKNLTIVAFPDGTLSSGTIYLTDKAHIHMYALSISVAQISHLRLYKYQDGKWELIR